MKKIFCITAGIISSLAFSLTAFAGTWQKTGNNWYYQNNGVNATGWVQDNGFWYYMNSSGIMTTGWQQVNGSWYYMNPEGKMATGWVNDRGTWYYMNPSGAMMTGWVQSNGKWYYMGPSGAMLANRYTPDGYYVNSLGEYEAKSSTDGNNSSVSQNDDENLDLSELSKYGIDLGNMDVGGDLGSQDTAYDHDAWVNQIYNLTNNERVKNGQSALSLDSELSRIADERAEEIANEFQTTGNISHEGLHAHASEIRSMFGQVVIRENCATGAVNPAMVVSDWMNSTGHKANLLNTNNQYSGIGIYKTGYMVFFVQIFTE